MTPVIPQIDPIALPGPAALFWLLLVLTFTLHVIPMNLVLGGSIIGAVARWRGSRGQPHDAELARWIGKAMPVLVSTAVTMGVAALLFVQVLYGRLFFVSSVLMAASWLAVVPLLIAAYYSAYVISRRGSEALALSWFVSALFIGIAFIYANNMSLMVRPGAFRSVSLAGAGGLHLNLGDPTMPPRFLHMVTGAVAVTALALSLLGVVRRRADPLFGGWAVQYGCAWFGGATILNLVFGVWLLASLPSPALRALIGRSAVGTTLMGAGILFALAAMAFMMAGTRSRDPSRGVGGAAAMLLLSVVLMVATRDFVRRILTDASGFDLPAWVAPQWVPIAVFFVLLLAAVAIVAWTVRALVRAGGLVPHEDARAAHDGVREKIGA